MNAFRIILILAFITLLAGCTEPKSSTKLVVTDTFPLYDMSRVIIGDKSDKVHLVNLLSSGTDPHEISLSPAQMRDVTHADVIFINGAGLEGAPLMAAIGANSDKIINTSRDVELISDNGAVNPHLWLIPKNAIVQARIITDEITRIDPENKDYYKKNSDSLIAELEGIDKLYNTLSQKRKIDYISIHNAFRYLSAYGLNQVYALDPNDTHSVSPHTLVEAKTIIADTDAVIIGVIGVSNPVTSGLADNGNYKELDIIETDNGTRYTQRLKDNFDRLKSWQR